jgi:CTP:molybdopterin cytidylyltransferase MocA
MADSSPPSANPSTGSRVAGFTSAGIVLAAGSGERFGGPKAPYIYKGERLVDRSVSLLRQSGLDPVIVVLGAWVGDVEGAVTVVNTNFASGMSGSLAIGIDYLRLHHPEVSSAVITLVDLPFLRSATLNAITESDSDLVQAYFQGEPGHPVKIAAHHWSDLLSQLHGDSGAKAFLRAHNATALEIDDPGIVQDLDHVPID